MGIAASGEGSALTRAGVRLLVRGRCRGLIVVPRGGAASVVKFPGFRFKHLLRQVPTPILPELITHRVDKKGFPTPLMLWLRRLRSDRTLTDLLSARSLQRTGLFRRNPLLGHEGDMWRTWTVLNLELWCRVFLEGSWAATEACVHPSAP